MSVANACNAITSWTESYGIVNDHDLSPFVTGALLVALADSPASDAELDLIAQMQQCLSGQEMTMESLGAELQWIEDNGVEGALENFQNNITQDNERELFVLMAALVATVERGVNAQEGTMLQKIGQALGFSQFEVQKLLGKAMQAAQGNYLPGASGEDKAGAMVVGTGGGSVRCDLVFRCPRGGAISLRAPPR